MEKYHTRRNEQNRKHSLVKNYIYNIGYQILILALPLITTPYVSRVLGAEGIGMYGRTNSISQYFVLFGCIGLNLYGQREVAYHQNSKSERSGIFFALLIIRTCSMAVSIIVFCCTVCQVEKYEVLYRIEVFELIASFIDITWFFQGMEEFKRIVLRNSAVKVSGVILIFLLVRTANDTPVYAAILVVTVLLGNMSLWLYLPQYIQWINKRDFNVTRHIKPALLLFIPQIATSVYNILDKSMIGLITESDVEVAYYEQAQKIIKIALAIPTAVGTVMLPRMANMYGEGNREGIKSYIRISMKFVCMLTFPLCFGIIGIAKDFVPWFFGDGFDKVYNNFLVISPIIVFVGISNVLGVQYLLPINRQMDYTKSVMIGTIVNLISNAILIPLFLSVGAAIGSTIAEASVTITQLLILRKEFSLKQFARDIYKYLIGAEIMLVVIILYSQFLGKSSVLHIVIEVMIGVVVYGVSLFIIRDKFIIDQLKRISVKNNWRNKNGD